MRNKHVDRKLCYLMTLLFVPLLFWGCTTDLEETPYSVITPESFYNTDAGLFAATLPAYGSLRKWGWELYLALQEITADDVFIPTRGSDWYDNGNWQRLQVHTWTETGSKINGAWLDASLGIARANAVLDALENTTSTSDVIPTYKAEMRFLRAFYYWWMVDLFGNVPIYTDPEIRLDDPPQQHTRIEVYDFIVSETIAALPDLKETFGAADYARATKGAAHALLATVYLNAEVYSGTAQWQKCIDACDEVINSGNYTLMPTFKDVFALENEGPLNPEGIFVVAYRPESGVGLNKVMSTLHYNQLPSSPWNGTAVLADFYNAYDTSDARLDAILVGQQYVLGGSAIGDSAFDRDGDPLFYTIDSPLGGATESEGPRLYKWPVDPNASGGDHGNDVAIFRYSHILLAKAEALFMLGNTAGALTLVNQVRERNFDPDEPLTSLTRDDILAERGFELLWEGYRRQDLIRTGHFLDAWTHKTANTADTYRRLFPIPRRQLDANPNLVQNPGY